MMQLIRPLAGTPPVTQAFGPTDVPSEPAGYWWPDHSITYFTPGGTELPHLHCGVDYGVDPRPPYPPILAAAAGVVSMAGWDTTGFGNCTRINHGDITTLYGHQSEFLVQIGEHVTQGQVIGRVGSTGNSTGPHLHWSVIRNSDGHYVSPVPYMTATGPPSPPAAPPGIVAYAAPFFVTTMAPCTLWDGPWDRLRDMRQVSTGVRLQCDAVMHGQVSDDLVTGKPDSRWYHISSGGWVKSARVDGNAPGSTP